MGETLGSQKPEVRSQESGEKADSSLLARNDNDEEVSKTSDARQGARSQKKKQIPLPQRGIGMAIVKRPESGLDSGLFFVSSC